MNLQFMLKYCLIIIWCFCFRLHQIIKCFLFLIPSYFSIIILMINKKFGKQWQRGRIRYIVLFGYIPRIWSFMIFVNEQFHIVSYFMNRQASKQSAKTTFIAFYVENDDDWSFTFYNFYHLLFCNEFPRKQTLFSTSSIMSQLLTEDWWRFYWNEINKTFIRKLYCKIRF